MNKHGNRQVLLEMEVYDSIFLDADKWNYDSLKAECSRLKKMGEGDWKIAGKNDRRYRIIRFK